MSKLALHDVEFCFKRRVSMKKYVILMLSLSVGTHIQAEYSFASILAMLPRKTRYSKKRYITRGQTPVSVKTLMEQNRIPKIVNGVLDLSNQNLTSLEGLNKIDSIKAVRVIDLRYNDISDVYSSAFPSKITVINLAHNSIKTLKKGAFTNLKDLHSVFLQFNHMTHVESGAFKNLPSLRLVSFRNNPALPINEQERITAEIRKFAPGCEVRF